LWRPHFPPWREDAVCCGHSFDARPARASDPKEHALATPNYGYEKRQRELAKKRKNEEKKQKKAHGQTSDAPDRGPGAPTDVAPETGTPPAPTAG
jgi:hypothetical protein